MKVKIFSVLVLMFSLFQIPLANAQTATTNPPSTPSSSSTTNNPGNTSSSIQTGTKHIITAEHPLAEGCVPVRKPTDDEKKTQSGTISQNLGYMPVKFSDLKAVPVEERRYICEAPQGTEGFMRGIGKIVRWVMMVALLLGVLAIAALGIVWAISGGDDIDEQRKLKEWLTGLIVGFLILFFFQLILLWIAPWIYQ